MRSRATAVALAAVAGSLLGVLVFAVETAASIRTEAVGLHLDEARVLAALLAPIRHEATALGARIAFAYAAAGAAAGALAAALALALRPPRGASFVGLVVAEDAVLWGLLAWNRAIERPALFAGIDALRPLLRRIVDAGEPWHPRLAAVALLLVHAAVALLRRQTEFRASFLSRISRPGRVRRTLGWTAAVAAASAGFGFVRRDAPRAAKFPLVVLVGIDAFRPDRLEDPARSVAPHLAQFAAQAVRFARAYTPIAQTQPAWQALLTASWPWRTGVRYPLAAPWRKAPLPTFPGELSRAGFRTVFATDCSRFNYQGVDSGFAVRLEPPSGALNFLLEKLRYRGAALFPGHDAFAAFLPEIAENRALSGSYDPFGYAERLARRIVREAEAGPTLFAVHLTAPHFPGDPVHPFYRRYVPPGEPLDDRLRMSFATIAPGDRPGWTRAGREALYDELLAEADAQLGVIVDALRSAGLYDEALVVVFSDHGESFHADVPELWGASPVHGARLSDEENRIVLAIKPPSSWRTRPRTVREVVRLIDVGPTILDASGIPARTADGVSLLPLVRGEPMPPLRLYAETGYTHAQPNAFDADHYSEGPHAIDAFAVRPDGTIEMTDAAHRRALLEKDVGAFDGDGWLVRSRGRDGRLRERCSGKCSPELSAWLAAASGPAAAN